MNLPRNLTFDICAKVDLPFEDIDYTHIVSYTNPDEPDIDMSRFSNATVYRQRIHDSWAIWHKENGLSMPDEKFINSLISQLREILDHVGSGKRTKVLFQCHAGISRSTASAFIFLAMILGKDRLDYALGHVISVRRIAEPNIAFIQLAEKHLKLEDRMCRALKNRGRRWKTDLQIS